MKFKPLPFCPGLCVSVVRTSPRPILSLAGVQPAQQPSPAGPSEAQDGRREEKGGRRRGAGKSRGTSKGGAAQTGRRGAMVGPWPCIQLSTRGTRQRCGAYPVEELAPSLVLEGRVGCLRSMNSKEKCRAGMQRGSSSLQVA